jgi:hypothetical protein
VLEWLGGDSGDFGDGTGGDSGRPLGVTLDGEDGRFILLEEGICVGSVGESFEPDMDARLKVPMVDDFPTSRALKADTRSEAIDEVPLGLVLSPVVNKLEAGSPMLGRRDEFEDRSLSITLPDILRA